MNSDAIKFLGLMRRAGALVIGETNTGSAARAGKAKIIMLAKDASSNAVKRAMGFSAKAGCNAAVLEYTKEELSSFLATPGCSMMAITDRGFAEAFNSKYSTAFRIKKQEDITWDL